jgi:hypothetical protein
VPWRGPEVPGEYPTLGFQVVDWIQAYLPHGPGDVQGQPIILDDELVRFLLRCYKLDPVTGRRVYDEALLSRAKGRAKSELAGMVGCAEAKGPVRFDGWNAHGEPVGRPVTYPFIRCLSTEEGQSGHTYLNVTYMLDVARDRHPEVFGGVDIGRDWQSSTRTYLPGGGEIRPSTASSAAKDGGKETFAVARSGRRDSPICAAGAAQHVPDGEVQLRQAQGRRAVDTADLHDARARGRLGCRGHP